MRGPEAGVEDEPQAGRERVGAEERVLAAVALVPAQRRVARDDQAEGREKAPLVRRTMREVRRLDLQVADPAPRRVGLERPPAAHERTRELGQRSFHTAAPAGCRHDVRVQEHDGFTVPSFYYGGEPYTS